MRLTKETCEDGPGGEGYGSVANTFQVGDSVLKAVKLVVAHCACTLTLVGLIVIARK